MNFGNWIHFFFFGIYPYIALAVCVLGCWARFDLSQYTWKTGSSQMLSGAKMRLASNLFHVGILVVLMGHLFGLLTPHAIYEHFVTTEQKQLLAMTVGGIFGVISLVGLVILTQRRFTDPRIAATSSLGDKVLLIILATQLVLGLLTIFASMQHMDGSQMVKLAAWAQHLTIFDPVYAAQQVEGASFIYRIHMVLGITIILITPFTRLIHIISAPIWYIGRRYQIVRQKG